MALHTGELQTLSIFELLEYIVSEAPPSVPKEYFSADFVDFVNGCLQKNPADRWDLKSLMSHAFVQTTEQKYEKEISFANWVRYMITVDKS